MTDNVEQEQQQPELPDDVEMLKAEVARYKAKHAEIEKHRKAAEQKARELEEAQRQAEEEGLKQREEFRTLYERERKTNQEWAEKYGTLSKSVQLEKVESSALSLAAELTRDTKRAELLKEQVSKYARYTDDGVVFEMGGVNVDKDKILTHIKENFPFLVDGSGATGGGAAGSPGAVPHKTGKVDGDNKERAAYYASKFNIPNS